MQPSVGVVIAARNASQHIGETLDSLLAQRRPPDEVVVINDGSTDNTPQILADYRQRMPCLQTFDIAPQGISHARNVGNQHCHCEYIAVLDADDLFLPNAIEDYLQAIAAHPEADLIYADCEYTLGNLAPRIRLHYPSFGSPQAALAKVLGSIRVPFKHSSMIYRRQAIEELGGYDETFPVKVDIELFLRFLARGKQVVHLAEATSVHRKHGGQITKRKRLRGLKQYYRVHGLYAPGGLRRVYYNAKRTLAETLKALLRG